MENTLFYGDNLDILRKRIKDETVDLCYIDPPFNSKRTYNQIYMNIGEDKAQTQAFIDTWKWDDHAIQGYMEIIMNHEGRFTSQSIELIKGLRNVINEGSLLAYIVSMTLRITEIQRVLKKTGSFYLHCDPTCSHYLKLVLDAIFCPKGGDYKNEIIWKRSGSHNLSKAFDAVNDTILFYVCSEKYIWNQIYESYGNEYLSRFKRVDPDKGPWQDVALTAGGAKGSSDARSQQSWRGHRPPPGRNWSAPRLITDYLGLPRNMDVIEKLEAMDAAGYIYWPSNGGLPRFKQYLNLLPGSPVSSSWTNIPPINSQAQERLGYPTQKPEALLERIIKTSSNEGDTVLDAYCGCGTTIAVAQRLKRNWIGIDITYQSISLIIKRLEDTFGKQISDSIILDGIPKDTDSAKALANKKDDRLRKEFEKWAILTYSDNRAIINEKKGADKGIDGIAYFLSSQTDTEKIVFQVKSGKVGRSDIAAFITDMNSENAQIGIFLTLEEPTQPMRNTAMAAGMYEHKLMGKSYNRIQIVTIREMIEEKKRLEMPLSIEVLKSAKPKSGQIQGQIV